VRYKDDHTGKETAEMKAEWDRAKEVIELLNLDQDTKEVFEDVIESRETYGIAYLEAIRNLTGEVAGVEFIKNTPSVTKTIPLLPYIEIEYEVKGRTEKRRKKFCKYKQELSGQTVYFREFGDPRVMDMRTGDYGEGVPLEYQANEILEFTIGTETYGEVRWIGQVLGVDGSRKAEALNNRYFEEGRHTPLMFLLSGGTLTDDSFAKLQQYVNDIKGEKGQHSFIVLEAENAEARTDLEDAKQPKIEVVKLADILQKDELFQEYLDNNRRRAQSAFLLPDLYTGYTTDFNRATAQTAIEVTEKQVFQPERESLAWVINHKLLAGYHFKYVEAYFLGPDISNPDDMVKILNVAERAGGLTPNKAKELVWALSGKVSEDYDGDWGNLPLAYTKLTLQSGGPGAGGEAQVTKQIRKASSDESMAIVSVMKEVRAVLEEKSFSKSFTSPAQNGIIKYNPDQLRDENGRFASAGGDTAVSGGAGAAAEYQQKLLSLADSKYPNDATYDLDTMAPINYTTGYQVSFYETGVQYEDAAYEELLTKFTKVSSDGKACGGKFDNTPEISFNVKSRDEAIKLMEKYNQHSVWDWENSDLIINSKLDTSKNKIGGGY